MHTAPAPAPQSDTRSAIPAGSSVLMLIGFVVASLNTRVPFGQIGPLAPLAHFHPVVVTILGVLPPLGMGLVAPLVPRLLKSWHEDRLLLAASVFALLGAIARPFGVAALIGGTLVAALAIGVVNVLIPVYVRRHFPAKKAGGVFGLYALAMGGGSALAAALVVPVMTATGSWPVALAVAIVPAVLAVGGSVMMLRPAPAPHPTEAPGPRRASNRVPLSRTWLAWSLACFFGVQTLLFYTVLAWLPSILVSGGATAAAAGSSQALLIVGVAVGGFLAPVLANPWRSQHAAIIATAGACAVSLAGLALWPVQSAMVWVPLLGLGLGGGQALPAVLYAKRGADHDHTARLSAFAQTWGFLIAATGPVLFSLAHSAVGTWQLPLLVLAVVTVLNLVLVRRAGTGRHDVSPL